VGMAGSDEDEASGAVMRFGAGVFLHL
jgi:hypothetical protein